MPPEPTARDCVAALDRLSLRVDEVRALVDALPPIGCCPPPRVRLWVLRRSPPLRASMPPTIPRAGCETGLRFPGSGSAVPRGPSA